MLEPYASKGACTVLRGGGEGDLAPLPDPQGNAKCCDSRRFSFSRSFHAPQLLPRVAILTPMRTKGLFGSQSSVAKCIETKNDPVSPSQLSACISAPKQRMMGSRNWRS